MSAPPPYSSPGSESRKLNLSALGQRARVNQPGTAPDMLRGATGTELSVCPSLRCSVAADAGGGSDNYSVSSVPGPGFQNLLENFPC